MSNESSPSSFQLVQSGGTSSFNIVNSAGSTRKNIPISSSATSHLSQGAQLAGLVLATPLHTTAQHRARGDLSGQKAATNTIAKILIKTCAARSSKVKDVKIFTLRNMNQSSLSSIDKLRNEIRAQLKNDVYQNKHFDIGYLQGSTVVNIRNQEDLSEIWTCLQKGSNVTLWCDGLSKSTSSSACKRARAVESSESEGEVEFHRRSKKKRSDTKDDKVGQNIKELKQKHGEATYTPMQYRIWAEMIVGGIYVSSDNPPSSTMFIRAGGGTAKKTSQSSNTVMSRAGCSPAKVIENRSKCYKQLSELKALLDSDVLSPLEYEEQKSTVMATLKNLG